ncbi:MAG TPA: putative Ig domain-containing protein, partial [Acetobacteraceae bacterium]
TVQSLTLKVTATDTSGLAVSDSFAASVAAPVVKPGITVSTPTAPQTWTDGQNADVVLPGKTFTDALGLKMTFAAYEVAGPNVTSWLHFNPATDEFAGTVPSNATGTAWLEVVASDAQHMSAADLFPVSFAAGSAHVAPGGVTSLGMAPTVDPSQLANMLVFHS